MYSDNNEIEQKPQEQIDINNIHNTNKILNESIKEQQMNPILKPSKDISESIVTLILDRIISNIIVEARIKETYSKLPEHCYNYLHKLVSTYLKNIFPFHENGTDNISYQKTIIFFDKIPINKVNKWDKIKEPPLPELDRHITGKNKVIKLSKKEEQNLIDKEKKDEKENNKDNISDINNIQINSKDEIEEIKSLKEGLEKINMKKINKRKKNKNKKSFGEIVREKDLLLKELEKINKKIKIFDKYKEKKLDNNDEGEEDENDFVLEMTAQDLKNIDMTYNFYNNSKENDLLRKERELLLIQKEKDRFKEEQRKTKEKQKKFKMQIKKNFESNILTFDPNGEIIRKLLPNINTIKKDLPQPKLLIKDKNSKIIPMEKRGSILKPIKQKLNKAKIESIIYNPKDKIKTIDFENKTKINSDEIKISGNNFELVEPSVGVVISNENENKKKEGGFEYIKKYNKPSMNEYSKLSNNNGNILSSYTINDNINIEKSLKDPNYIGFKEEFSDNNPLFQDVYQVPSLNETKHNNKEKENQNINLNNLKNNNKFLKIVNHKNNFINSYDAIKMNSNRYKGYNSIKLNNSLINNNLKNLFTDREEYNINKKYKSIDNNSYSYLRRNIYFFQKNNNLKKKRDLPIILENNGNRDCLDEYIDINKINKFNFRIIKNKKWGNDIDSDPLFQNRNKNLNLYYLNTDINTNINKFRKSNLNKNNIKKEKNNLKIFLKP